MSKESLLPEGFMPVWPFPSSEESKPGIDSRPKLTDGFECRTGQCSRISQNPRFIVQIVNGKIVDILPESDDEDGYDLGDPVLK